MSKPAKPSELGEIPIWMFSINGGTPSYHPFWIGIFPYKPSILEVPPFMEPPIHILLGDC